MKHLLLLLVLAFNISALKSQILTEDFEGNTFPPAKWITMEDCVDSDDITDVRWQHQDDFESAYGSFGFAHTGNYSAMSSFGFDVAEAWLVTPQFTPTSTNHELNFFYRQAYTEDYGSELIIKVSTASQNTFSDFTDLLTITESMAPTYFTLQTIDLSTYVNTPIYIAFVKADEDGDEWYIDDVTMEPIAVPGPTNNPNPIDGASDVNITNTQTSQINLSWNAPTTGGPVTQYDLWMGNNSNNLKILGHPTNNTAHPKTFHFNTTYHWKASAVNISGESSNVWSFTTNNFPTVNAPYSINFENGGFVPDGMDQSITNDKFWHFSNDPSSVAHLGNAGSTNGTNTQSGNYFAFVDDSGDAMQNGAVMLTPFIDISSLSNPAISLYIISDNEGDSNVEFQLEAYDGTNWITVLTSNTNTNGWEEKIVDLSSFSLPNLTQFRFKVMDNNSNSSKDDFAIDDFKIDNISNLSSISSHQISDVSISPIPVIDILNITSNKVPKRIEIYNINGKLLLNKEKSNSIDLSNLSKGNYLVTIYMDNFSITKKIIK